MEPIIRAERLFDEAKKQGMVNHATGDGAPSLSMVIDAIHCAEADGYEAGSGDEQQKAIRAAYRRPRIVCLCGSTRFMEAFQQANLRETIAGKIVLSIGCNTKCDADLLALGELTRNAKAQLDELHKRKIDLADEVLVLNVGGYVGESTRSEIAYAIKHGKPVRWLDPDKARHSSNGKAQTPVPENSQS